MISEFELYQIEMQNHYTIKNVNKSSKQAGAELGQAQLLLGLLVVS